MADLEKNALSQCPRCGSSLVELDAQHLIDAQRFGVLTPELPWMYHCYGCFHTVYSHTASLVPDPPDERTCANCERPLDKGRRRYCSERCARPTKAEQIKIDRERSRRLKALLEGDA